MGVSSNKNAEVKDTTMTMRWPSLFTFLLTIIFGKERRKDESMSEQRDMGCVWMIGWVRLLLTYQISTCGD